MAPQFGVLWLCALLWGCSSLSSQKGYKAARAHYPHERPLTSGVHYSDIPVNTNYKGEMQARRQQGYVPPQRQSVPNKNSQDGDPVAGVREERRQNQPNSGHGFLGPSTSSAKRYKHSSRYSNPFGLLVQQHTQNIVNGISFPTINQLQRFVDAMKSSYLRPGSDLSRYFKTARETIRDVEGESSLDYASLPQQHGDNVNHWRGHGASDQTPDEPLSFPDPDGTSAGLPSSDGDANPESSQGSSYPQPQHSFPRDDSTDLDYPEGKDDILPNVPENPLKLMDYVQQRPVDSPTGSIYEDSLLGGPPKNPNQDLDLMMDSVKEHPTPVSQKHNIKESVKRPQTPTGDYVHGRVIQRVSSNVPPPIPLSLDQYDQPFVPRLQIYIPTQRKGPDLLTQLYYPTGNVESKNLVPNYFQPLVGVNHNNFGPVGRKGLVRFKAHRQSQALNQLQPDGTNLHPSSTDEVSSQPDYLEYQGDDPSVLKSGTKTEKDKTVDGTESSETSPQSSVVPQKNYSIDDSDSAGLQSKEKKTLGQMKKVSTNQASRPSDQQSASKGCVIWVDGGKTDDALPKQIKRSPENALLKSRNRFATATAYLSKTCYTQYLQALKKAIDNDSWKLAQPRRKSTKMSNSDIQQDWKNHFK